MSAIDPRQVTVYEHVGQPEPAPVASSTTNPRHLSLDVDHRTPPLIVDKARRVLGEIDLDPFSSESANGVVNAKWFYSGIDPNMTCVLPHSHTLGQTCHGPANAVDGFDQEWYGNVFCNPPGGKHKNQSNQKRAWFKLVSEYEADRVKSAFFVCFSVELLQTTQVKTPTGAPLPLDFPICFPRRRIAYVNKDGKVGKSPPHSSCLVLLPEKLASGAWSRGQLQRFEAEFVDVGRVVVPRRFA